MKRMTWILIMASLTTSDARSGRADQQPGIDNVAWKWSDDGANPLHSAMRYGSDFKVEFIRPPNEFRTLTIRFMDGGKEVFAWKGHPNSVFIGRRKRLYFADFYPDATGCKLVAVDLDAGKRLWETRLKGLVPSDHSQYRNMVNLEFFDKFIVVYGKESHGSYIELLDPESGKTVGHKRIRNQSGAGL